MEIVDLNGRKGLVVAGPAVQRVPILQKEQDHERKERDSFERYDNCGSPRG